MTAAQPERAALVETMRTVGPDAPTLCGDWTTRDLAAHLVVRERRLDATAGVAVPFLAGYTAKVQRQVTDSTDWDDLLDKVASGPPLYSPFKLFDPVANLGDAMVKALGRGLPLMARLTLAKAPARVSLRTPDGKTLATVGRGPELTVTGEPQELLLFISGRDAVRLEFDGDEALVDAVRTSRRGL
jgi:hypothetical protein